MLWEDQGAGCAREKGRARGARAEGMLSAHYVQRRRDRRHGRAHRERKADLAPLVEQKVQKFVYYIYVYLHIPSNFLFHQRRKIGLALSVGPEMAAISPPLHAVRAQHGLPSARAPRARLLSLAHPALILPKHSPVRPRLNCLLTLDCSRVPCSELTSSRSTARLFELIRRRPGSKGEVRSPNSNTRPPGPFSIMIYILVAAAARAFLTIGPC